IVIAGLGQDQNVHSASVTSGVGGNTFNAATSTPYAAQYECMASYFIGATGATINSTWTAAGSNNSVAAIACFKAATVTIVPQSSPIWNISGTYWNGSASAADTWTIQNVPRSEERR